MKTNFIIVCILFTFNIYSQDQQNDVKTPNYSNVVAYVTYESSDATREYFDFYFKTRYPNAEAIDTYPATDDPDIYYSSSRRFNCHGYAWYMMSSEGSGLNDPRWIGYYYTTDEDIFMTDGSYTEVQNEVYPGKVSWASGDHSAISTSETGRYISKWNEYPLMEHDWDDSPFGTQNLKYYQLNCFRKIENKTINTDLTRTGCQVLLKNVTIQNNVNVNITTGNWLDIQGTFNAYSGVTLQFTP